MLRFIYADDLHRERPGLAAAMFADRAGQFAARLGWDVTVKDGAERDEYDAMNPLYVIWEKPDGGHGGSMRFLPTTGSTMVNDHFGHLTGGVRIESPLVWECTRFCLGRGVSNRVSAALMLGGLELGLEARLQHAVGVFDAAMVRIYRRLGWGPTILGSAGRGRDRISVGVWEFDRAIRDRLLARADLSSETLRYWHARSLGSGAPAALAESA